MNTRTLPLTASSQGSKSDLAHCGVSDPNSDPMDYNSRGSSVRGVFPSRSEWPYPSAGVSFPTQGLTSCLLRYRQILDHWATGKAQQSQSIHSIPQAMSWSQSRPRDPR